MHGPAERIHVLIMRVPGNNGSSFTVCAVSRVEKYYCIVLENQTEGLASDLSVHGQLVYVSLLARGIEGSPR